MEESIERGRSSIEKSIGGDKVTSEQRKKRSRSMKSKEIMLSMKDLILKEQLVRKLVD